MERINKWLSSAWTLWIVPHVVQSHPRRSKPLCNRIPFITFNLPFLPFIYNHQALFQLFLQLLPHVSSKICHPRLLLLLLWRLRAFSHHRWFSRCIGVCRRFLPNRNTNPWLLSFFSDPLTVRTPSSWFLPCQLTHRTGTQLTSALGHRRSAVSDLTHRNTCHHPTTRTCLRSPWACQPLRPLHRAQAPSGQPRSAGEDCLRPFDASPPWRCLPLMAHFMGSGRPAVEFLRLEPDALDYCPPWI